MVMQQQDQKQNHYDDNASVSSSNLPAKKRKFPLEEPLHMLPIIKRVWAFHPFDLNEEYTPLPFDDVAEDDGIICAICNSTDGDPLDPIVLCDGCDLMVHTTCYGHPLTKGVPEGDWFCSLCLAYKIADLVTPKSFTCCLCPEKGGAMKATINGKWAHVVCSLFVPEVYFVDSEGREGIDYSKVPKRRWETKCYICKTKNGCVIDCSEPKCRLSFHVTCGLKDELCIEYTQGRKNGGVVAGFCSSHTELWKKQQQTGKFKIVPREELDR
ncbi:unnamed protein product [Withania somnifera]